MKTLSNFLSLATSLLLITTTGCGNTGVKAGRADSATGAILINQVGYYPEAQKIALIRVKAGNFDVVDVTTGKKVFGAATGAPEYWPLSGDTVRVADFSGLTTPGTYRICLGESDICSADLRIGYGIYTGLAKASVKAFYYNRSGFEITSEFGSEWARPAGHPDTAVILHESAASPLRPAGTVISSPGGWYDAGDYNKYIVNSSITNYTLLLFYQLYPEYCRTLSLNIPESHNDIPDVVDELLYNLKWMLTMQDPADGGVYHKLTNKDFGGFEMPDRATTPRYVVQKTTQAALDFTAVMAMASRVFANDPAEELRNLSETCLEAARKSMKWAEAHPAIIYSQPKDIKTGEYGDSNLDDELAWAKTEMALAEDDPSLTEVPDPAKIKLVTLSWNQVEMLGLISLSLSESPGFVALKTPATDILTAFADTLNRKYHSSPYRVSLDYFYWGSNSDVANQAMLKLIVMRLTGDKKYLPSIQGDVDYILGRNATGYCFVTGFGDLSPLNIHHRPSGADGIAEPVPGFLVGGPNISVLNDCILPVGRSQFPAASYTDSECSYSTNEICINWNAPLVFVMGAMDAMK